MTQLKGRDWWTDGSVIPNQSNPVCYSFDLNPASGSAFLYPLCSTLHSPDNYMDIVDPVISVLSPGRDDKKCFQFIEQTLYGCAIKMTVASDKLQRYLHKHSCNVRVLCAPPGGLFDFSHCESRRWIPIYWIESSTDVGAVVVVVSGWWFQIGNS